MSRSKCGRGSSVTTVLCRPGPGCGFWNWSARSRGYRNDERFASSENYVAAVVRHVTPEWKNHLPLFWRRQSYRAAQGRKWLRERRGEDQAQRDAARRSVNATIFLTCVTELGNGARCSDVHLNTASLGSFMADGFGLAVLPNMA